MAMQHWDTVTIVGVGLIGGSIGLALRERKLARRVIGVGRNAMKLRQAQECGAVTETTADIVVGVADADLIVVCTPIEQVAPHILKAARHCRDDVLLTDVGSTKQRIVADVEQALPGARGTFIGSHPLAGSEKTGVEHSQADLFVGRAVIITPTEHSPGPLVTQLEEFWKSLGGKVFRQSPREHDDVVSAISHVPHVVASALAAATPPELLPFVAGGWLDITRVAAGDVELWRQILTDNRAAVLKSLAQFSGTLDELRLALEQRNDQELTRILLAGKKTRDAANDD